MGAGQRSGGLGSYDTRVYTHRKYSTTLQAPPPLPPYTLQDGNKVSPPPLPPSLAHPNSSAQPSLPSLLPAPERSVDDEGAGHDPELQHAHRVSVAHAHHLDAHRVPAVALLTQGGGAGRCCGARAGAERALLGETEGDGGRWRGRGEGGRVGGMAVI